jgi:hypothetical protein
VVPAGKEFLWRGSVSLDLSDPSYFLCELPGWKWLGMKFTRCVLGGYLWIIDGDLSDLLAVHHA